MATQRRPADPEPPEPPAAWEEDLARLERGLAATAESYGLDSTVELQLVIARQLRELLLAIRPLTKHPWYPGRRS